MDKNRNQINLVNPQCHKSIDILIYVINKYNSASLVYFDVQSTSVTLSLKHMWLGIDKIVFDISITIS